MATGGEKPFFYNPDVDTKIAGLYDLQHTIGRGHYAVVKLARHVFTGEKVAVKVIDKTKLDDVSRDHLFQEVVCMKLVQHPNVVRLYEVIDTPTKLYLVLELGDGGDLYDYITSHGNGLCEKVAKRYFRQIVTAIAYCHKLRVVHRDLKPENVVFFEKLGLVKLTDFGFSNKFTPGTHLETACGSLAYSAPEILLGNSYDAPKVDIWSLGVILYMLVSGKLPFQETNDSETITKIMDCDYSMPPNLSNECKRLISRLLIRDPQKRAHLDDILQADWLKLDDDDDDLPIELFSVPLISREHLSFEDHMEILTKMAEGKLASVEEIQLTLDRNEYNHIAATYYLLAERKLKRNYIEEYKRLLLQSQLKEKWKQELLIKQSTLQQQQSQINVNYSVIGTDLAKSALENLTKSQTQNINTNIPTAGSNSSSNSSRILTSIGQSNVEDRVRRFSMILEDEEEEEDEENQKPPNKYNLIEPISYLTDSNNFHTCLAETSEEAMLEEEEEEMATVAGLACVRSELLTEQNGSSNLTTLDSEHIVNNTGNLSALTRPCSRTSGSGAEASDGTESDVSISAWSTSGLNFTSSLNRITSTTRSLPPVDNRRKHPYRRSLVSHRPLVAVKSSPQLLKHIAEEDWTNLNSCAPDANSRFQSDTSESECPTSKSVTQTASPEDMSTPSMHTNLSHSFRYVDDQMIGLKPNVYSNMGTQQVFSGTHSPAWTRRFFATPTSSRPASIGSWNAVFNSMANEQRRLSFCCSPVEAQSGNTVRKKVLPHLHHIQSQHLITKGPITDRRCSGPPGLLLAISGMYHLGSVAPLPSRSGSDTSFLDQQDNTPIPNTLNNNLKPDESSNVFSFVGSHCDENKSLIDIPDSVLCTPTPSNKHNTATVTTMSTTKTISGITNVRSPHREPNQSQKAASWCSSTPMLYEVSLEQSQAVESLTPKVSMNEVSTVKENLFPIGASAVREQCTPIREEDEFSRVLEPIFSKSPLQIHCMGRRRRSESSSSNTNSACFNSSNITQIAFATLAESESTSTISQLPNINNRFLPLADHSASGGNSSQCTSNFSLSSLATSLRDSRYMIDIIRGTFELQCQYQRRFANSIAGVGGGDYPSGRASTSTSVRSLIAISENYPISNRLKDEFPHESCKLRPHHRPITHLSPDSVSRISTKQYLFAQNRTRTADANEFSGLDISASTKESENSIQPIVSTTLAYTSSPESITSRKIDSKGRASLKSSPTPFSSSPKSDRSISQGNGSCKSLKSQSSFSPKSSLKRACANLSKGCLQQSKSESFKSSKGPTDSTLIQPMNSTDEVIFNHVDKSPSDNNPSIYDQTNNNNGKNCIHNINNINTNHPFIPIKVKCTTSLKSNLTANASVATSVYNNTSATITSTNTITTNSVNNNNTSMFDACDNDLQSSATNCWTYKTNNSNQKQILPFILNKNRARLTCCTIS